MSTAATPRYINFSELDRWDVKYFTGRIKSKYPLVSLSTFVREHNEKVRPFNFPDDTFKILGVNNTDGIFHAYDALGKEIKQPYKKVSAGDFAYNPYRINVGSIGWVPDEHDGAFISPAYVVFSIDETIILPELFWFILKSEFFNKTLRAATAGSVRMNLTYPLLETLKIPILPLSIQQKIVEYWNKAQQKIKHGQNAQNHLIYDLNDYMIQQTRKYKLLRRSKLFSASFSQTPQWDVKAGRAAVFKEANPSFVRLGDYTEECAEMIKPWEYPDKLWPIYGVNNKDGVLLSTKQETARFNAAYKRIEKDWFFHNPTRANVGSLGIVPEVPDDAIASPEYQVWKLTGGFEPEFMDLLLQTQYFLTLVSFNRVGGVKQRMYYANLAEIRLPMVSSDTQKEYIKRKAAIKENLNKAASHLIEVKKQVEKLILGTLSVEYL
jgi:hypothetical protein